MRWFLLLLLPVLGCNSTAVDSTGTNADLQLSYLNNSGEDFRMLDVEIFGKAYHFTSVEHGANTAFIDIEKSYPYHFARVITTTDTLVSQPIDFVGEQLLPSGRHTLILDIDTTADGHRILVFKQTLDDTGMRDYHTRSSDVIDNLFLALNKKDWKAVNSFYSSNARIVDITHTTAASASDYFKKLFEQHEIYYIYLHEQHATNNGVRAKAFTRRGELSAELPLCFDFIILNNRIIEQYSTTCEEK